MERPLSSVTFKMYALRRSLGLAPERKKRTVKPRRVAEIITPQQPQQQPSFSFNFNPTRTEVHKDHVRLYF